MKINIIYCVSICK